MTAVPLTDQQLADIRAQIKQALRTAVSLPTCPPLTEHGDHDYEVGCALCHGDVAILTNAVVAVVQPELDRLRSDLAFEQKRVAYWQECRDNYAAENKRLIGEKKQLRAELETLRAGAVEREGLLTEARDALEAAGQNGAHGDDWPAVAPAISALTAERDRLRVELADTVRFRDFHARSAGHLAHKRDRAEQLISRYRDGHIDAESVIDRVARTLSVEGDEAPPPPAG